MTFHRFSTKSKVMDNRRLSAIEYIVGKRCFAHVEADLILPWNPVSKVCFQMWYRKLINRISYFESCFKWWIRFYHLYNCLILIFLKLLLLSYSLIRRWWCGICESLFGWIFVNHSCWWDICKSLVGGILVAESFVAMILVNR